MAIRVALQSIDGRKYGEVTGHGGVLDRVLPIGDPRYPMLRYVDPYGNTFFNGMQMYPVLEELDRLAGEHSSEDARKVLEQIRELAIQCRDHPHLYLRFAGD